MTQALTTTQAITAFAPESAKYAQASKAANTVRAYRTAWSEFAAWCATQGVPSLPAESQTVVAYLTALAEAEAKFSTISVKQAGIAFAHRVAHHVDPTTTEDVRLTMAGIAREVGRIPQKKAPLTLEELRRLIAPLDLTTLAGRRDKALLLVGFAGAFRRSELVALDVADTFCGLNGGLKVTIRKSKTDQEGKWLVKMIPPLEDKSLCPVGALREWLVGAIIRSGAIFRRVDRWGHLRAERLASQSVAHIIKAAAERAGLDARQFSGHSLRSGFITAAASAGVESRDIMGRPGTRARR